MEQPKNELGLYKNSDPSIEPLLCKLNFLAKLKSHEKIDTYNLRVINDNYLTSIYRSIFTNDDREKTYKFILDTINEGLSMCLKIITSPDVFTRRLGAVLLQNLEKILSSGCLMNLQESYSSDRLFCSRLESLSELLRLKLTNLNDLSNGKLKIEHKKKIYEDILINEVTPSNSGEIDKPSS